MHVEAIGPDLWRFADTCNVYVLRDGDGALAIDFGSGRWREHLGEIGSPRLEQVLLTHHHAETCVGLAAGEPRDFVVHAPTGEEAFLDPGRQRQGSFDHRLRGCPDSYAVMRGGVPGVRYDLAGFSDFFWRRHRIRLVHTPGHGPHACSAVLDTGGRQVVCCGDAAHAGATVPQPWNLEWDHWTGRGALAAWEGVRRLQGLAVDALCPAQGPVVRRGARRELARLAERLLEFYHVKGQIAPGTRDRYVVPDVLPSGAHRILPGLYQFGTNGALLVAASGAGLVVDPQTPDLPALEALRNDLGGRGQPEVCVVSHYHYDHCDAIPLLRARHGTRAVLHPEVAHPLAGATVARPWLPAEPIAADELWPAAEGCWTWREFAFQTAHWPGQTWGHTVFMTTVAGRRVLFGGDSFQPPSRWNGTGGFCAYNGSRFDDGFRPSAELALRWKPDYLVCGHHTACRFEAARFRHIGAWSDRAAEAVRGLCPTGDLAADYYNLTPRPPGALFWLG